MRLSACKIFLLPRQPFLANWRAARDDLLIYKYLRIFDSSVFRFYNLLDTPVWNEPEHRGQSVEHQRDSRLPERGADAGDVHQHRHLPFPILSDRLLQNVTLAFLRLDDLLLQDHVSDPRHQQNCAVEGRWSRRVMILAEPGCRKRNQGQPEQQMK